MENLLEINVNDFINKEVKERISSLENNLKETTSINADQYREIKDLKEKLKNSDVALNLLDYLREEFASISKSEENEQGYYNSKQKNQFLFIEKVLLNLFNVKSESGGWHSLRNDGTLKVHLAVNYFSNKEILTSLLKILIPDCEDEVSFISSFKIPYDYTKEEVKIFISDLRYNTNGAMFGISQYWIENGAKKTNVPYDLMFQNKYILDDDIFDIILGNIKLRKPQFSYLFAIPEYNKYISKDQIVDLGDCLKNLNKSELHYDHIEHFISENINDFNEKTLDYLYSLVSSDNEFKTLHWEKFPIKYQMMFLHSKDINEVLKALTHYSCKWTSEQKESFLKEYTNE